MKICFNDNGVKPAKGRECNTCYLKSHSPLCFWFGVCDKNASVDFESPSEIFKI